MRGSGQQNVLYSQVLETGGTAWHTGARGKDTRRQKTGESMGRVYATPLSFSWKGKAWQDRLGLAIPANFLGFGAAAVGWSLGV